MKGIDCYYILRTSDIDYSNLFGELRDSRFEDYYQIEMYLETYLNYNGKNDFMSNFGYQIQSQLDVSLSYKSWKKYGPFSLTVTPREGDLVYIPLMERLFEIRHVDSDDNFYPLGRGISNPYYFRLELELFKYSQETLATGIGEIDYLQTENAYTQELTMGTGSGNYIIGENVLSVNVSAKVVDWNPNAKTLKVVDIKGTPFDAGNTVNVTGETSGTTYTLSSYDPLEGHIPDDLMDNRIIEDIAEEVLDFTEQNPFGNL